MGNIFLKASQGKKVWTILVLKYDVKGKTFMVHILWQRLLGKKVVFITSMDKHGEKIDTAAAVWGSDPSEHCDVNLTRIQDTLERCNINPRY